MELAYLLDKKVDSMIVRLALWYLRREDFEEKFVDYEASFKRGVTGFDVFH